MLGFDKRGSGDHGVIILNDWLSDTSTWDGVRQYLQSDQFTWVFADLRGYGRSRGQAGEFTVAEAANDVLAVAAELGWHRFSIVGHSMSSLVAMHLAQHHGNLIERVVLVTPSPPRGFGLDDATVEGFRDAARGDDAERLTFLRRMQGTRLSDGWIHLKLERWRACADSEAVAGYVSIWAQDGLPDQTTKILSPVLALAGDQDREDMRSDALAAALQPLAEDVHVVPLASSGHCPMQEVPPLFATLLERFLSGLETPGSGR